MTDTLDSTEIDLRDLTWRGQLDKAEGPRVAVIGSRACTEYGEHVASEIAQELSRRNLCTAVLHGYGIAAAAARGALAARGKVLAVVPASPEVFYPRANEGLQRQLMTDGLVVSVSPEATHPTKALFLRAIESLPHLVDAVVVVEASVRSNALMIARIASEIGKPVYGVPGPITSAQSQGVHDLIKVGTAEIWTSAADLQL